MDPTQEAGRRPGDGRAAPIEAKASKRGGCLLTLAMMGLWWFLLRDFVTLPIAIMLMVVGPPLARGGLYLSLAGARFVFDSVWYAGAWLVGLLLLAGAAATLAPAAPGNLLTATATGWSLLGIRAWHLENAIEEGDVERAAKIAGRGLGDPAARDSFGTPILQFAKDDPEMLGALLAAGMDPNVRDPEGRTLLAMGVTGEAQQLLLDAGAVPPDDFSGGRARGREDWLVARGGGAGSRTPSGISIEPDPLHPGDPGTARIVLDNPEPRDRLLDVRATLDYAVFLVGASHDGAVMDVGIPGTSTTVRWPRLALPAGARGELELRVLARTDDVVAGLDVGDLGIDVRVIDLPQRTDELLSHRQKRAGPPARAPITSPAGLFPIVPPLLLAALLAYVWRRARAQYSKDPHFLFGRIVAGIVAVICAASAGSIIWSLVEPYARFDEASCRVLDRRVFWDVVETSSRDDRGRTRTERGIQLYPVAAVEIDTGDELWYSAGLATGGITRSVQELRLLSIGLETKCWVDPREPSRFTLVRGLPMAGGVGLTMLGICAVVLGLIAARLGRGLEMVPVEPPESEPPAGEASESTE